MEKKRHKGYTITVVQDGMPDNPLKEDSGMLGQFFGGHGRYQLGSHSFSEFDELQQAIREYRSKKQNPVVWESPVYLYDHSGLAFSLFPFSCPWDSGQVGEWLVRRKDALGWFGGKRLPDNYEEKIQKVVTSLLEQYEAYMNGHCYGYEITNPAGNELMSRFGFLGDPDTSGLWKDARSEVDFICETVPI